MLSSEMAATFCSSQLEESGKWDAIYIHTPVASEQVYSQESQLMHVCEKFYS